MIKILFIATQAVKYYVSGKLNIINLDQIQRISLLT